MMQARANPVLFLIGSRGSGKTTVAQLLGERLGWRWIDADEMLELQAGCSIRQVFAEEGEVGFRDRESAVLAELCLRQRHVIATGGGVVLRAENRARLKTGRVIWLTGDAETLWGRLQSDASTAERRPALTVGGLAEVSELLQAREPLYRACADVLISTVGRTAEEVAQEILIQVPG